MANWLDFRRCPGCSYDFATGEGNPPCPGPDTCEHGVDAGTNVPNVLRWRERLARSAG